LPRGAKVQQDRRSIHAQIDVRRLHVQVEQTIGVHLAQTIHDLRVDAADETFGKYVLLILAAVA